METPLVRSRTDRWLAGVCGGLGQYLHVKPDFVRAFFLLLALASNVGFALLVYVVLWIALPSEGSPATHFNLDERLHILGADVRSAASTAGRRLFIIIGVGLIAAGVLALVNNLGFAWFDYVRFRILLPVLLIVAGLAIIVRRVREA